MAGEEAVSHDLFPGKGDNLTPEADREDFVFTVTLPENLDQGVASDLVDMKEIELAFQDWYLLTVRRSCFGERALFRTRERRREKNSRTIFAARKG